MAASKITNELSTLLECPICLETIEKPVALPCLHFYCEKCIMDLPITTEEQLEGIRCPICNEFTLKSNRRNVYFIQNILDIFQKTSEESHCDICKSNEVAIQCQQCKQQFCQSCADTHTNYKLFKNHTLVPIDGSTTMVDEHIFCELHHEEVVKLYCKDCKTLVCLICQATKHKPHQVQTVPEALQDILPTAKKNLNRTETVLINKNDTLQVLEQKEGSLIEQYKVIEAAVESRRLEAIRQINETAAEIQSNIKSTREMHTKQIRMHIQGYRRDIKYHENIVSLAQNTLNKTKDVSLLATLTTGLMESLDIVENDAPTEIDCNIPLNFTEINEKFTHCFRDMATKGSDIIPRELRTILNQNWVLEKKLDLSCTSHSLSIFNNKLWCGNVFKETVEVLSMDGTTERSVNLPGVGFCLSIKPAWDGLVICKKDAIYIMDNNSENLRKMYDGLYCDISFHGGCLYGLECQKGIVQCFVNIHGLYAITKTIKLTGYNLDDWNTIQVTDNGVFIGQYMSDVVTQHDDTGAVTATHGRGQLSKPRLCGADLQGHLLIVDSHNKKLKSMNPATGHIENIHIESESWFPMFAIFNMNKCFVLGTHGIYIYKPV